MEIKMTLASPKVVRSISFLSNDMKKAMEQTMQVLGKEIVRKIKWDMVAKKTGRVYEYRKNGITKTVQASAPNESPAVAFGDLINALEYTRGGFDKVIISADLRKAPYARALELGTKDKRIAPRKYILRAIEANQHKYAKRVADIFERGKKIDS